MIVVAVAVIALVAGGLVALLATGGDDDDDDGESTDDPTEQTTDDTDEPSDDTTDDTTEATTDDTDGGTADLTAEEAKAALLTIDDVGDDDFTVADEDEDDDDNELKPEDTTASDECKELLDTFSSSDENDVKVEFEPTTEGGPSIEQTISVPADDRPDFDVLDDYVEVCGEFSYDDGQTAGDVSFSAADDIEADIGDQTVVLYYEIHLTRPYDVTLDTYIVFWDRDRIYSSVGASAGVEDDLTVHPADPDLAIETAELADEKLAEVIEEAG